ncbi:MAG: DUF481 domain-containing protein [Verrucomicrobia bacterium]|nr:DUF481 domain-containing protein [Verrucomicrobiota bacterium]
MRRTSVFFLLSFRSARVRALVTLALLILAARVPARADLDLTTTPDLLATGTDVLGSKTASMAITAEPASTFDVLIYKDGDRVRGHLKERSATEIVFISERFGRLVVPVTQAKVILANGETDTMAEERARSEEAVRPFTMRSLLSVRSLTTELQHFFGPWRGRFAVSTQVQTGPTDSTSEMAEIYLKRRWKEDTVQFAARYDYGKSGQVVTSDMLKAEVAWRHDFRTRLFTVYSPTLEMNRAYVDDGLPADYVLAQQEIGVGYNVLVSPARNLRVGISENLFDQWRIVAPESHTSKTSESAFLEADMSLPWQMSVSERGVWYPPFSTSQNGWENRFELDKKLSETFTVGLRHEMRYNNPSVRVQDYTLLKILMGIDF